MVVYVRDDLGMYVMIFFRSLLIATRTFQRTSFEYVHFEMQILLCDYRFLYMNRTYSTYSLKISDMQFSRDYEFVSPNCCVFSLFDFQKEFMQKLIRALNSNTLTHTQCLTTRYSVVYLGHFDCNHSFLRVCIYGMSITDGASKVVDV